MGQKKLATRFLASGESVVASLGLSATVILLVTVAASWWWNANSHRSTVLEARRRQLTVVSNIAAHSLETMLAEGELTPARRVVFDLAHQADLSACRVILPNGKVIADSSPALIDLQELPATWPAGDSAPPEAAAAPNMAKLVTPLDIPGRGRAYLQLEAQAVYPVWAKWELQSVAGGIAVVGMVALLAAYRRVRLRLRAMGAVGDALHCVGDGERSSAVLQVSESLGREAAAWNSLLAELEDLRKKGTSDRSSGSAGAVPLKRDENLADAFDAMWHGLLLIDDRGRVRYGNGAAAIFLGVPRDRLTGTDAAALFHHPDVLEALASVTKRSLRARAVAEVDQASVVGGAPGPVVGGGILRFSFRSIRKTDPGIALVLIEDVTQQRMADRSRNSFVAQATHELRTPLTNIRLYVEALLEEDDIDPVKRAQHLNVVNAEVRRLERIVTDMLSVSDLEAGSLKLAADDVRLDALFQQLQADYSIQATEKKLKLTFKLPPKLPVIQADRDKIMIALGNLIGNALKYTPSPGEVTVSVRVENGQLITDVTDTGIGINDKESELVFEKFYRSTDNRTAEITGSGLGLAMARQIARLHEGDITLRSVINKGSTFTFTLPAATPISLAA